MPSSLSSRTGKAAFSKAACPRANMTMPGATNCTTGTPATISLSAPAASTKTARNSRLETAGPPRLPQIIRVKR